MNEQVILQCVKVGSKLKVRIISPGFQKEANCQFPRAIREEGRKYSVPLCDIKFAESARHKFFYRVGKNNIKILGEVEDLENLKIYEDTDESECIICMAAEKDVVFAPCGHYCSCETCASQIKFGGGGKCPMCRTKITALVKRDQIQI